MAYLIVRKKASDKCDKHKLGYDKYNFTMLTVTRKTYKRARRYNWQILKSGKVQILLDSKQNFFRPKYGTMFLNFLYEIPASVSLGITVRHENGNKLDFRMSNLTRLT